MKYEIGKDAESAGKGLGYAIRIHSILTLKQVFTYSVAKVENQTIIETGLYKFIRHPGYLGQLMIFIGISISISNWLSILAMIIPVTIGYLYRILVEERFMAEQLGEDYLNYPAIEAITWEDLRPKHEQHSGLDDPLLGKYLEQQ